MDTKVQNPDFVLLWSASSKQVYAFILSILPNWADADEAFQDTGIVLWNKFAEFTPGTNFTAWACRVAYLRVLYLRRRKRRDPLPFSDAFLESMQDSFSASPASFNVRREALIQCIKKLSARDRDLLNRRYRKDATAATAAAEVNRSLNAVYKALSRIREALFYCIERTLHKEGI